MGDDPILPETPSETLSPLVHLGGTNPLDSTSGLVSWAVDFHPEGGASATTEIGDHTYAYKLLRLVGTGGHGEVWAAEQGSLGRVVAVKQLSEAACTENALNSISAIRERLVAFRQEAITTALLDHPNIVPVYDLALNERGRPLLAMKLVEGRSWDELIAEDGVMPFQARLAKHLPILLAISNAVAFAHSKGIIHRDLKPAQVIVGGYGQVSLMDWGLSVYAPGDRKPLGSERVELIGFHPAVPLANAANPAGTPAFMAPEQTEKKPHRLGPWTDVFLLGGCLYYLLTDTCPHLGSVPSLVFEKAASEKVEPPSERDPRRYIPSDLSGVCMRALRFEPSERISIQDFIAEIQAYLSGVGKQRESMQLVLEVRDAMSGGESSYKELAVYNNNLLRAESLWPDNLEARVVREHVLKLFVEAALAEQDLVLARVQAEAIESVRDREAAIQLVESHERRQRSLSYQRRAATILSVALLVLVVVLAANAYRDHAAIEELEGRVSLADRDANRATRQAAMRARASRVADTYAQSSLGHLTRLVEFALVDSELIVDPVAKQRHLALATELAEQYRNQFETQKLPLLYEAEETSGDPVDRSSLYANLVGGHLAVVRLYAALGRYDEVLTLSRAAVGLCERLRQLQPDVVEHDRLFLRSTLRLASASVALGDWLGADRSLRETLELPISVFPEESSPLAIRTAMDGMKQSLVELQGGLADEADRFALVERIEGLISDIESCGIAKEP